jgi:hypothetical protein
MLKQEPVEEGVKLLSFFRGLVDGSFVPLDRTVMFLGLSSRNSSNRYFP